MPKSHVRHRAGCLLVLLRLQVWLLQQARRRRLCRWTTCLMRLGRPSAAAAACSKGCIRRAMAKLCRAKYRHADRYSPACQSEKHLAMSRTTPPGAGFRRSPSSSSESLSLSSRKVCSPTGPVLLWALTTHAQQARQSTQSPSREPFIPVHC